LKIAVSAVSGGLEAEMDPRFGRCQFFVIVDSETLKFENLPNTSRSASSGAGIQAAQIVAKEGVKLVLTGSIGPNASRVLSSSGIDVITSSSSTVREAVERFKSGQLQTTTSLPSSPTTSGLGRGYGMGLRRGGGRGMGRGYGMGYRLWQTQGSMATTPSSQITPSSTSLQSKEVEIQTLKERIKSLEEQLKAVKKLLDKK
jgi:predicted Fe-Mo cluster-binding NifX family protein